MKTTFEMNQVDLEKMIVEVLESRGLRLSDVENAMQWKHRPKLRVIVSVEPDPEALAHTKATRMGEEVKKQAKTSPASREKLDPSMFPPGTDVEALGKEDALAMQTAPVPGESFERQGKR